MSDAAALRPMIAAIIDDERAAAARYAAEPRFPAAIPRAILAAADAANAALAQADASLPSHFYLTQIRALLAEARASFRDETGYGTATFDEILRKVDALHD